MAIEKTDKFGNPQCAIPLYINERGWGKGFCEIKGQLYKVECNPELVGEGKRGDSRIWVTITKVPPKSRQRGGRNGGGL